MTVISSSKEIWAPSGSTAWTLQTQFEVTSQNTANNTSTISLSGYLQSSQGSFGGSTNNALVLVWHDNNANVDKQVSVLYVSSASAGQRFDVSATYTATHNADGTLSGYSRTVWLKRNGNNYTPDGDYINTSNTALPSIPRESVPTVNQARVTLGDSFTVNTNRRSNTFTHTIRVIAGNTVLKEVTNVGDSTTINSSEFAATLLNSDSTAISYPLEIRCVTTGVSTTYAACAVTMLTSQERHAPILSNFTVAETSGNSDIPSGTTVTNLSQKHISININPNYSVIQSAVLTNGTQNVNLVENSNTATLYEADIVPTDGTYSVRVISSRGYTATDTVDQTTIEYTLPYFEEVTFTRTTDTASTGTLSIKGGYWSGQIGSTTNSLTTQYYSISGGAQVNLGIATSSFDNDYSIANVDYDRDYRIEVYIEDAFGQAAVAAYFLKSAKPLFWMGRETARCAKHWIFDGDGLNGEIEIYPSANGGIRWGNTIITKAIFDTLPSGGGGGGGGGITVEIDPTVPAWAKQSTKPTYTASEVGAIPAPSSGSTGQVLKKTANGVEWANESDPTVSSWAKASTKPAYTASEVGALPASTVIPTKTSDLTNDSGYITGYTETDPTVPSWAKASTKPTYTASEVGALPSDTFIPEYLSQLVNDILSISFNQQTGVISINFGANTYSAVDKDYADMAYDYDQAISNLDSTKITNPSGGSTGQFLQKTASGTQWAAVPASVSVEYYNNDIKITSGNTSYYAVDAQSYGLDYQSITDQLAGKISNPSGGSTGQFLQKTASGTQWATVSGGGSGTDFAITDGQNVYPFVRAVELTSSGVEGLYLTFDDGSTDGLTYFLPDGVGLNTVLTSVNQSIAGKIDMPSGGSVGQYLRKTSSGVAWENVWDGYATAEPLYGTNNYVLISSPDGDFNVPTEDSIRSTVVAGNTDPVNSIAVIAYINSLDATNTEY